MFTTKFTKKSVKGRKPPSGFRFDKGGLVQEGPFDKFLSPYDKMRHSENIEDRRGEDGTGSSLHEMKANEEAAREYTKQPTRITRLGADAGMIDIDQTAFRDEKPSYIKVSKKRY